MKRPYVELCARCQEGELADHEYCLREIPGADGRCAIEDDGPVLLSTNVTAVELFQECQGSCKQVVADDKTYLYIDPCAAEALMRIRDIAMEDRLSMMQKLLILQQVANQERRARPPQVSQNKKV